jgi:carboxypeptidase Q
MKSSLLFLSLTISLSIHAQKPDTDTDARFIKTIFDQALNNGRSYPWLSDLCTYAPGRLAGSPAATAAVAYTQSVLDTLRLDSVWLQPCTVPHWVRGEKEQARIVNSKKMGSINLRALAIGNSVGTGPKGLTAEVVEVRSLDEVDRLGQAALQGKIVFYNRPMDPTIVNTFAAYGGAVDQRGAGASRAAKYGALGVIVRSMTNQIDTVPHSGAMSYDPAYPAIPAIAISTADAEILSAILKEEPVRVFMQTNCKMLSDKTNHNVIGEIRGSEYPNEIILVGGHLDSWDVAQGAHDDGAGCIHAMEVLRILKATGYQPKRTIRCVLFANEENGLVGGRTYAAVSNQNQEYHMAAIESDRGGFTPRGFTVEADETVFTLKFKQLTNFLPLLEPYGLYIRKGGSGADISPLKSQQGVLIGFEPDTQRYFDFHHTANDNISAVNKRELELGAATITALVFLIDKYGIQ